MTERERVDKVADVLCLFSSAKSCYREDCKPHDRIICVLGYIRCLTDYDLCSIIKDAYKNKLIYANYKTEQRIYEVKLTRLGEDYIHNEYAKNYNDATKKLKELNLKVTTSRVIELMKIKEE